MSESIKARFFVTKSAVTIFATFHECQLSMRWKRSAESVRHVRTLIANLDKIVDEGLGEVFVQDEARRLDWEIEQFYRDNDEDKPDDS